MDTVRRSVFCLQPPGDQPNRKSVVDSLLLGCIPVLFHEAQLDYIPWHWGHKFTSSVYIDYKVLLFY
jgi:xyloglucan galactosyltransferase MUR3